MPLPELLRRAIDELMDGGADTSDPVLQSLLSTVADKPDLLAEAFGYVSGELQSARAATAVLHLDGPTVVQHRTSADRFASYVQHLARSVKEVAKTQMGRSRLPTRLLIAPVFDGSIGLRLEVPYEREPAGTDELVHVATAESNALRFVGALMTQASMDDVQDEELGAHVQSMSATARTQLRLAVIQQVAAGWDVSGEVIERGQDAVAVRATSRGAVRLVAELDRFTVETTQLTRTGTIDGVKHSLHAVYFIEDDGSRFALSAPNTGVLLQAAGFAARPEDRVAITFVLTTTAARGDQSGRLQRSRTLTNLAPMPRPPEALDSPLL
jgi:hypothetical protein